MSTKHEKYVDSFETPTKYVCIDEKTRSISFGTIFHEYTIMDIVSILPSCLGILENIESNILLLKRTSERSERVSFCSRILDEIFPVSRDKRVI